MLFDVLVASVVAWEGADARTRVPVALARIVLFAALMARRRWPLVTVAVAGLGMLAGLNLVSSIVALYTQASRRGPARPTWLAVAATVAAAAVSMHPRWSTDWKYVLLAMALFVGLPVLAGLWMYQRGRLLDALRGRAEQAERERDLLAERAVAAERRRIAGEMHDVVAHRIGVIALQAGALTVVSDDPRTGQVARSSARTARRSKWTCPIRFRPRPRRLGGPRTAWSRRR